MGGEWNQVQCVEDVFKLDFHCGLEFHFVAE